jgi:hypothetical protein
MTDRDRLAALVAHWRERARKMLVPFPGLTKNLPTAALLDSCADELERLLTAEAARTPSRHEHEAGAPLLDDCDGWCRHKHEVWARGGAGR